MLYVQSENMWTSSQVWSLTQHIWCLTEDIEEPVTTRLFLKNDYLQNRDASLVAAWEIIKHVYGQCSYRLPTCTLCVPIFIVDIYMRPGRKLLTPVWSHPACWPNWLCSDRDEICLSLHSSRSDFIPVWT